MKIMLLSKYYELILAFTVIIVNFHPSCALKTVTPVSLKINSKFAKVHPNTNLNDKLPEIEIIKECTYSLPSITKSHKWVEDMFVKPISSLLRPFLLAFLCFIPLAFAQDFGSSVAVLCNQNYLKYFLAGAICCSFSHGISVPFDVVKTRKQVSKDLANLSVVDSLKKIIAEDGVGMIFKGLIPTLAGYSVQGSLKFGFYEIFKLLYSSALAYDDSLNLFVFILAGASAELIGSSFLTPFEACRIRLVTNPSYSDGLLPCLSKMYTTEGVESLFRGLPAILAKQVPYTIVQLSTFEQAKVFFYSLLENFGVPLIEYRWMGTVVAALSAAMLSSLASQPGDTLLSAVNKQARQQLSSEGIKGLSGVSGTLRIMKDCVSELGFVGLFTGAKARLVHVGLIVVVQLVVYDYIKQLVGIPLSTGH